MLEGPTETVDNAAVAANLTMVKKAPATAPAAENATLSLDEVVAS